MENLLYQVALSLIEGVGPITARLLLSHFGDARSIFEARPRELAAFSGITEAIARSICQSEALRLAERQLHWIERYHITPLFIKDPDYPERLRRIDQAPILLYYKGSCPFNNLRTVGIIGTRQPSTQGLVQVERLVEELAPYQPMIISGLAYGIDIAAHRAALQYQLPTIGVLGHGLQHLYPARHKKVAQAMLENGGLLTEYPFTTKADPRHFPMRNRIVAGLCDALIVVETARKGGSIITVEYANSFNRDVFAVPGRLHDKTSAGCNWLIKTHKAALLESASDIGYVMRWDAHNKPPAEQLQLFETLSEDEKLVVALLKEHENLAIDRLSIDSQLPAGTLATVLLEIECKGLIRTLPGKRYMLIR